MLNPNDCLLRYISKSDIDLVLSWRNQERIRANMYSDHVITLEEHKNWFSRITNDTSGRYLIFEWRTRPAGFVSVTQIDATHNRAEWAFYLGDTTIPKGAGVAMEYLALEYIFETLRIRKLVCEVFAFNTSVIKMHTRFGFEQEALFKAHAKKGDEFCDVVALAMFGTKWKEQKAELFKMSFST